MNRIFSIALISMVSAGGMAQWSQPTGVPAYHAGPPSRGVKLEPILTGMQLANFQHPVIVKAYQAAARVPKVLYQLPCYCYCDRSHGHKSLHSCFESEHGASCSTCMKEALFAEQETKKGKTPRQIRTAVMRGDYNRIDLAALDK